MKYTLNPQYVLRHLTVAVFAISPMFCAHAHARTFFVGGNNDILTYNAAGDYIGSIGSSLLWSSPQALQIGPDGNLYGIGSSSQLLKYDFSSGQTTVAVTYGSEITLAPRSFAIGSGGTYYVGGDNNILTYNAAGNYTGSIASSGLWSSPQSLQLGSDGNLYGIGSSSQLLKYDFSSGQTTVAVTYGSEITLAPRSFAIGSGGTYYVGGNNNILTYNAAGNYTGSIASSGLWSSPQDMQFGVGGRLYGVGVNGYIVEHRFASDTTSVAVDYGSEVTLGVRSFAIKPAPPSLFWAPAVGGGGSGVWSSTNSDWANSGGEQGALTPTTNAVFVFSNSPGTVQVDGAVTADYGLWFASDGYVVTNGSVNLAGRIPGADTITTDAAVRADIASVLQGSNGLVKMGEGTLVLSGNNDLRGRVLVSEGTTVLTNGGSIHDTNAVSVSTSATVTVASSETIGSLAGGGSVNLLSNQLTTGGNNSSTTFSGGISGSGSLVKNGSGAMTLSGSNSYSGPTSVNGGRLVVTGSANNSVVTVGSGATLSGSGSVGGIVLNVGSTISPGNSPGTFTVAGNATWNPGVNYNWQIHDAAGTAGNPLGWDLVNITGSLDLSSLTVGSEFYINLWSLSGISPDANGPLVTFAATQNYSWTIASAAGGIIGFDPSGFIINTSAFNGTSGFQNDLLGGSFSLVSTNNNLNLLFTAAAGPGPGPVGVPEPGTWAAAALLSAAAVYMRWRRRSSVS